MPNDVRVEISAVLGKTFKKVFKSATKSIDKLNDEIKDTKEALNATTRFRKLQESIKKVGQQTKISKQKLDILKQTTGKTGIAAQQLGLRVQQATNKYNENTRKLNRMQKELAESGRAMRKFGLDTRNAARSQDKLQRELDQTIRKQTQLQRRQRGSARLRDISGRAFGAGATALAGVAGAGFLAANTFRGASAFESSVAELSARNQLTQEQSNELAQTVRTIAANSVFTASQAGDAAVALGKAGFGAEEITKSLQSVVDFSTGERVSTGFTAQFITSSLSQFGKDASEAQDFLQKTSKAVNSAAIDVFDFSESLKFVGPVASSLKIPFEDTAALITLLGKSGLRGGIATRAFRTSLLNLAAPTKDTEKALDALTKKTGLVVKFFDEKGEFVGLENTIDQLQSAVSLLNDQEASELIKSIFGGGASTQVLSLLRQGSTSFADLVREINKAPTEDPIGRLKDAQLDTVAGQLKLVSSAFEELTVAIFTDAGIAAAFKDVAKGLAFIINQISAFVKAHPRLTAALAGIAAAVTAVVALFGVGALIVSGFTAAMAAFAASGIGATTIAIFAGITAAITFLITQMGNLKNIAIDALKIIADIINFIPGLNFLTRGLGTRINSFIGRKSETQVESSVLLPNNDLRRSINGANTSFSAPIVNSGGNTFTVNVDGSGDPEQVAKEVEKRIMQNQSILTGSPDFSGASFSPSEDSLT